MLEDGEIILRSLADGDQIPMARLADNKNIWDNLRDYFPRPYSETNAEYFISQNKDQHPLMIFAIEYNGKFCGVISLIQQTDVHKNSAELGYWLGEPFWNKGIVTKAVKLITDYGLNRLNFIRIYAGVFEYNIASMKVLEKNGYKKEGVSERHIFKNGKILDEHRYYILK